MEREKPLKSSKNAACLLPPLAFDSGRDGFLVRDDADTLAQLPSNLATERTRLCAHSGPRPVLPVADILKDTVSAMEYDFNIRLSILVGQVWTESKDRGKVSPVIRAEQAVFRAWIREGHQGVYRFSQLYLWGNRAGRFGSHPNQSKLASVD